MAGPEPYPQEKWTREQEAAYAEGRKSAQGTAAKGTATRSGGRRKRIVRTEAGAKRYKVPIGAEIGSARNAQAAEAQKDTDSVQRYQALVGQDPQAQATAMRDLELGQLQRLAQVAYSWRTSNPEVVRLRIGVANELRRRGLDVNDFGGLGRGSTQPTGPAPAKKPLSKKRIPAKKPAPAPKTPPARSAMSARKNDRKLRELSVPQLRQALGAFSKISPEKRPVVARFLVRKAVELGVPHFLGKSVIELSGHSEAEVLELAGRWKHGWIPLDAAAMRAKMKGGKGKPWWSGGKQKSVSPAARMRKSVEAGRIARGEKKPPSFVGVPKQGGERKVVTTEEIPFKGSGNTIPGTRRIGPYGPQVRDGKYGKTVPKPRKDFVNNKDTKGKYAAIRFKPENRQKLRETEARTDARKAAAKDRRATNAAKAKEASDKYYKNSSVEELRAELAKWDKYPGAISSRGDKAHVARLRTEIASRGGSGDRTNVVKSSSTQERGSKMDQLDREIAELEAQEGKNLADWKHLENLKARRGGANNQSTIRMGGSKATGTGAEPFPAAANYLEMHGTAKTREKLADLQKKRDDLKAMRRKTTSVDLEIKGLTAVLARGNSGKA